MVVASVICELEDTEKRLRNVILIQIALACSFHETSSTNWRMSSNPPRSAVFLDRKVTFCGLRRS